MWLTFILQLLLQFSVQLPSTLVVTPVMKKLAAICPYHVEGGGTVKEGEEGGKREEGEGRKKR